MSPGCVRIWNPASNYKKWPFEDSTTDLLDSSKNIDDSSFEATEQDGNDVFKNRRANSREQGIHDSDNLSRFSSLGLSFIGIHGRTIRKTTDRALLEVCFSDSQATKGSEQKLYFKVIHFSYG